MNSDVPILTLLSKSDAIVLAAAGRFATAGFAATRISDVADDAGVGKGTVYEHFRSKEELLLAACLTLCRMRLATLKERISGYFVDSAGVPKNAAEILHEVLRLLLLQAPVECQQHCRLFVDLWTISRIEPSFLERTRSSMKQVYDEWEGLLDQLARNGTAAGVFAPKIDPRSLPKVFSALMDGMVWQLTFRPETDVAAVAQAGADMYLAALGAVVTAHE